MTEGSVLKGARILVVEDHWHIARALKTLLDDIGAGVIGPAATVAEAKRLVAKQKPDLAIVDINLKGEMAYALIEQLHDQGVRLVIVTGYSVLAQAIERIAVVVHKPFNTSTLLAALRQATFGSVSGPTS
jgi:DNA-binding response OmpR family regulator